jgi:predicted RND superfamily exporter protein
MLDRFSLARLMPPLVAWLARWKIGVFLATTAVFILAGLGMRYVVFDPDVLVYFDRSMPERQALETIESRFGRTNEIVFVLRSDKDQSMIEGGRLRAVSWLHARASQLPQATAVRSPLGLFGDNRNPPQNPSPADLRSAIDAAGFSARSVISKDETVAAVAAIYPRSSHHDIQIDAVTSAAKALQKEFRQLHPDIEILMTGRLMMDRAFLLETQDEIYGYAALQIGVLALILLITFRSFYATATLMTLVLMAGPITIGAVGWAGIPLNGISSAASTVLLGLAVATGVHIVLAWQRAMSQGLDRVAAVTLAMETNAAPVTLSAVTTMVSFLCLNFAASPPFGQLGNVVSFGLVVVLLLSFTLLPALLLVLPESTGTQSLALTPVMRRVGVLVIQRSKTLLFSFFLCAAASVAGIAQITFDDTFSHYFDERFEVRRATDLFEDKLSGTIFIDFSVPVSGEGGPFQRDHIEKQQRFTAWLKSRPAFAESVSLETVRNAFARQSPASFDEKGLPSQPGTAQALRHVYQTMLDDGLIQLIDAPEQHARFSVVLRGVSSSDTLAFASDAKKQAEKIFGGPVIVTGLPILSAQLSIDSTRTMLFSMVIALAGVSLLMLIALRDARLGLISLIPNIFPAIAAMGIWGAFVGEVSFAATVVGALTFGIVVDDTVHLLMKYQSARRKGLGPHRAIQETFRSVGVAVVVTTIALAMSFAVFMLSGFLVNQHLGSLTALTLIAALIADLLFLPPLILQAERDKDSAATPRSSNLRLPQNLLRNIRSYTSRIF